MRLGRLNNTLRAHVLPYTKAFLADLDVTPLDLTIAKPGWANAMSHLSLRGPSRSEPARSGRASD